MVGSIVTVTVIVIVTVTVIDREIDNLARMLETRILELLESENYQESRQKRSLNQNSPDEEKNITRAGSRDAATVVTPRVLRATKRSSPIISRDCYPYDCTLMRKN